MPKFWTPLPPLTPIDLGTPYVESGEHYFSRLCHLLRIGHRPLCRMVDNVAGLSPKTIVAASKWNGPGSSSRRRILALEELTGVSSLRHTTFWALEDVLSNYGLTMASNPTRRWCPVCIADNGPQVERLIWTVSAVTRCKIHDVYLENLCPSCGAASRFGMSFLKRRNCSLCGMPLWGKGRPYDGPIFYKWVDQMIEGLVDVATSLDTRTSFPQSNLQTLFARLLALIDQGELIVPRHLRKEFRQTLKEKISGQKTTVATLLNIAAVLGVTPAELIVSPEGVVNARLLNDTLKFHSLPLTQTFNTSAIRLLANCLQDLMQNHFGMLPPVHLVARQFQVHVSTLRAYYPEVKASYIEARATTSALSFRNSFRIGFQTALHLLGSGSGLDSISSNTELVSRITTTCRIDRHVAADTVAKARTVFNWRRQIEREPQVSHIDDSLAAAWLANLTRG